MCAKKKRMKDSHERRRLASCEVVFCGTSLVNYNQFEESMMLRTPPIGDVDQLCKCIVHDGRPCSKYALNRQVLALQLIFKLLLSRLMRDETVDLII